MLIGLAIYEEFEDTKGDRHLYNGQMKNRIKGQTTTFKALHRKLKNH
jgi:hypothetical protein